MNSPQRNPGGAFPDPVLSNSPVRGPDPIFPAQPINAPAINNQPANAIAANPVSTTSGRDLVGLRRSYYFSSNDRYEQEQNYQKPLTAPSFIDDLLTEKVTVLRLDQKKTLHYSDMLGKLRIDGVYCDQDPQIYQKCTDHNILRLEQRILREKGFIDQLESTLMTEQKTNYFKMNGELKLHNDLLADEITRPQDLAFEQSEAYQTKEQNAILCDRMHSYKKRYYRLHIVVGKIILNNYSEFFSAEDKLALQLKELYKEWERRTSLALIPFYMERLKFMEDERYKRNREGTFIPGEDTDFLLKNIAETERKLANEKLEVQGMAERLYQKWKDIKKLRKDNGFSATNLKLMVHKSEDGEFFFNLMHEEPSSKTFTGAALPSSEISRRNDVIKIRAFIRLIINGHYVTRSKKAFLKWPNLELEIAEQFEVYLFTMPSSIQLEIVIGGLFSEVMTDVINLEVPGSHVKALTSAATLIKDISFSKVAFEKRRNARKVAKERSTMTEEQKVEDKKRREQEEIKAKETDTCGIIYVKTEWKGEGPDMPPMRQENVFRQSAPQKNRKNYTDEDQRRMLLRQLYIDVNDPRNESIIKLLRETKNEFLLKLLKEDSKNPCHNLKPFRHMLLEARQKDPSLQRKAIPMLESEIIQDTELLDKLEALFKEQAFKEYLEKKIEEERQTNQNADPNQKQVFILQQETNSMKFDTECIRRRQMFFDKLKHFQREQQTGANSKSSTQYKSVVREFELLDSENPLIALFNKMFITGRKLKPVVQKKQPVSIEAVQEAKILIHIIKGFNVPIRNSAKQDIMQIQGMFNGNNNAYGRMGGMGGMSGMGGPMPRPTASTFNQLQQSQIGMYGMGGMGGMGGPGMDMRASMVGASMMGATGFGQTGGFNRGGFGGVDLNARDQMRPRVVEGDIRQPNEAQNRLLYRVRRVEPMVEVRVVYNDEIEIIKTTMCADGDFPEWNEILEFPLKALNEKRFTRQELLNTKTMIYITLFDAEMLDVFGALSAMPKINYRYLGSFSIPLISLLNNPPKIDAIFKVERPVALFNYQVEKNTFFFLNLDDQNALVENQGIPNTYISMSISLDPVLELSQDNELEYYIGLEKQNLLASAGEWVRSIKKGKFEKRNIRVFGENVSGQSVLLCRYITPQNPPTDVYDPRPETRNDPHAIDKAARFVSLIPQVEDNQAFAGQLPDIWCTSQEFLDLGAGDVEEHAILLCNYFNFIDQNQGKKYKSYLVLGLGYPEGRTAYVMRRDEETNHVELWNPLKGEAYFYGRSPIIETFLGCITVSMGTSLNKRMNDAICQLKSVACVISSDNVWANIQQNDDPVLITYDLKDTSAWKPFFTDKNRANYFPNDAPIQTVQNEHSTLLKYMRAIDNDRANVIAQKIQSFVTGQFEKERLKENRRTKWNNQIEKTLNSILASCEMNRSEARNGAMSSTLRAEGPKEDDLSQLISRIQDQINSNANGMKSWGFPINVTFISLPLLWEEVKNTKLHLMENEDAEFSFSVYVKPYSHNVMSVWFFLLVLTKERQNKLPAYNMPPY